MSSDLVEPVPIPVVIIDGWGERELRDGLYLSAGYQIVRGEKVIIVRIAQRVEAVRRHALAAQAVIDGEPVLEPGMPPRLLS